MEWKMLPIGQLKPAAYNPRKQLKPGDKEYEKIKKSIEEFGYVEPIIVNYDMTVISGHQRLTVLKNLGYEEVQCVVVHIEDEDVLEALKSVAFADICITSDISLTADPAPGEAFRLPDVAGIGVVFELAEGEKCERCWKILPDVGTHAHPGTCARCDAVLTAAGV